MYHLLIRNCPIRLFPKGVCGGNKDIFRVGFTPQLFVEVNENDAVAAARAWAQKFLQEGEIGMVSKPIVFSSISEIRAALSGGGVEAIQMTIAEYAQVRELVSDDLILCGATSGSITTVDELRTALEEHRLDGISVNVVEYMDIGLTAQEVYLPVTEKGPGVSYAVIVGKDTDISSPEDLWGRKLVMGKDRRMSLARPWLQTLMAHRDKGPGRSILKVLTVLKSSRVEKYTVSVLDNTIQFIEHYRLLVKGTSPSETQP